MKKLVLAAGIVALAAAAPPANAQTCTRNNLMAMAADYFKAVETHKVSALPTAANVRITENAAEIKPGEGLFQTGGKALLTRTIADTGNCSTLSQAVVEETKDGTAGQALIAVRLKSERGKVSEIETVIARMGDFAFKPDGVLATKNQDWTTLLPAAKRMPRETLKAGADKYYVMFEDHSVKPPFATPCNRWENGTLTTRQGDCSWSGQIMKHPARRYPVIDTELGVVAGITNFQSNWLDVHLFKFNQDGKIDLIQTVDGPGSKDTGWPLDK
jgi:hypothetical protein